MILLEETQVADATLPIAELRQHLRLGTGFAEDSLQDPVLGSFLRAAMAAIEGRIGKALLSRRFVLRLNAWRGDRAQPLPVAPVTRIESVTLVDADGAIVATVSADRWRLEEDTYAPVLKARGASLPSIPRDGRVEIRFDSGYGEAFGAIPADLRQAVLLLAAHYYEYRDETTLSQGCMPFGVTSLIARYVPMRMGFGA
ncbi:head-tail connector protein [Citreimonas sp.]|uniref:head-tail connector protein n=1 Tax=Citreimonas sp. TaxID=3036715 RepID=UPI0035C864CD